MDSAGPDVLSEMSEQVPIDMEIYLHSDFYQQNTTTIEMEREIVLEQSLVLKAELVALLDISDSAVEIPEYQKSMILGIEDTFVTTFPI